jgi:hypothetical protein
MPWSRREATPAGSGPKESEDGHWRGETALREARDEEWGERGMGWEHSRAGKEKAWK